MNLKKECGHLKRLLRFYLFTTLTIAMLFSLQKLYGADSRDKIEWSPDSTPLVLIDGKVLLETRERIRSGDSLIMPAFAKLLLEAKSALQEGPFSVMDKPFVPPSGDKHDFMSVATYHWPNPATPDSLPYIRRDGFISPDWYRYDTVPLSKMTKAVITLSLAYFLTEYMPYAKHAIHLLKTWFLDERTRMNPHLNYGQAIRGVNEGRGAGIIDTRQCVHLVDAITLLPTCNDWSKEEQKKIHDWFHGYLLWLLESKFGKSEAAKKNNHGTWYEVQVATYAMFTGENDIAQHFIGRLHNRIAFQIQQDGKQPAELVRTRSFHYSVMNLEGLCHAVFMGERLGFDLAHFCAEDGGSIKTALDFLLPFALKEKEWPYQQVTDWQQDVDIFTLLVNRFSKYYPEYKQEPLNQQLVSEIKTGETALKYFLFQ